MKVTRNYWIPQPRRKQQQTSRSKELVPLSELKKPVTLFLDQASEGGYSLYDNDSRLFMSGVFKRGKTPLPEFKKEFIKFITELIDEFNIKHIFHEEVYDSANMITTEVLFYLKHAIQDLGYFTKGVEVMGIHHKTWKTNIAKPNKFKFGNKNQDKKEVRKWVKEIYPLLNITEQDEYDAIGMGISVMIIGKGKKNFYQQAKFNKRLPVEYMIYENVFDIDNEIKGNDVNQELEEKEKQMKEREELYIKKLRKPFREAYKVGGLVELELNRSKGIDEEFKRYLFHQDVLAYKVIPKSYKNWGVLLLEHGISPERFDRDNDKNGEFIIFCCRKKRK